MYKFYIFFYKWKQVNTDLFNIHMSTNNYFCMTTEFFKLIDFIKNFLVQSEREYIMEFA